MTWVKICGTTNVEDALASVEAGADALGFIFATSPRQITPEQARQIVDALPASVEKVGVFVNESVERIREITETVGLTALQLHGDEDAAFARKLLAQVHSACRPRVLKAMRHEMFAAIAGPEAVGWDPVSAGLFEVGEEEAFRTEQEQSEFEEIVAGVPELAESDPEKLHELLQPLIQKLKQRRGALHGLKPGPISAILIDSGGEQRGGTGKAFDWTAASMFVRFVNSITDVIIAGGLTPDNVGQAIRLFRPYGVDVVSGVERQKGKKDPAKLRAFVQAVRAAGSNE